MNKGIKIFIALAIAAFLLAGSFTIPNSRASSTSTFIVGWGGTALDNLNPFTTYAQVSLWILTNVYDSLCVFSANQTQLLPDLAQSWQIYPGNGTAVVHLNPNAKWSDGLPVTSQDVNYSYYLAAQSWSRLYPYVNMITSISTPDENTVIFHYHGALFQLVALNNVFIVPYHIWKNVNASTYFGYNSTSSPHFVGSGPFLITNYTPNQYVQITKNPNYFNKNRMPHIDSVIFQFFTSMTTMISAFQAGQIDAFGPYVEPSQVGLIKNDTNAVLVTSPSVEYFYLAFNVYPHGQGNPTLRDVNVRHALAHAIDLQNLTQLIWHGYAVPTATQFPPTHPYADPSLKPYSYNITLANQILDSHGYKMGPNGYRVSPNGTPLKYTIIVPSSMPEEINAANIIATNYWSKIGVQTTVQAMDTGTMSAIIWPDFKQDIDLWDWLVGPADPTILSVFLSTQTETGTSDSGYTNLSYDALYNQMVNASTLQEVKNISYQLQVTLYNDLPYLPLYCPEPIQSYSKKWTNISTDYPGGPFGGYDWRTFLTVEPLSSVPQGQNNTMLYIGIGIIVVIIIAAVAYIAVRGKKKK
jgi:peptide/nickel transport system substrate-binding protein